MQQKVGVIAGWCVLALLAFAVVSSDEPAETAVASPVKPSQAVAIETPAPPVRPQASASDARAFMAELDSAIKDSESALRRGDLKSLHDHSKRMNQLKSDGERFGSSIFDSPFGRCFGAGVGAQSWWMEQLSAAQRGGKETRPGTIASIWKDYLENRSECLESARGGGKTAETEQVASTSDTPPRDGCLKVLGVRQDGQVGTVAYTCPKK